jgi:PKD repeat protein
MSSRYNLIYANNFIGNTKPAIDDDHNDWDNGAMGNYWSEFDNSTEGAWDNNSDGIVDSCYSITSGNNQDCFPLINPWAPLENQRPLVNIYSPAMNAIITNTVTIKGTAQDIDGEVLSVEISIDGHTWRTVAGTRSWSYNWDTTTMTNGDYIISARSYDGISYSYVQKIYLTVKNTCTLSIDISPINGGSVTPSQGTYQIGALVNITAYPFDGYLFGYWDGDFNGSIHTFQILMDSDKIITAHFTKIIPHYSLSITTNPSQGGVVIIEPNNETFPINTLVMITAIPDAEYIFLRWAGDYSSTNSTITITMNNDKNLMAYFEQRSPSTKPPIVYFSYSIQGKKVTFTDKSTDIDGFLQGWQWDFGDNNYSTQQHPIHTYKKYGNYTVMLVATDNTEDMGNYTAVIIVKSGKNLIPSFEWIYLLFVLSLLYILKKKIK